MDETQTKSNLNLREAMKKTKSNTSSGKSTRAKYSHAIADERKKLKRKESDARLVERAKLDSQQQLNLLDSKFGKNKGAQKERARLNAKLGRK